MPPPGGCHEEAARRREASRQVVDAVRPNTDRNPSDPRRATSPLDILVGSSDLLAANGQPWARAQNGDLINMMAKGSATGIVMMLKTILSQGGTERILRSPTAIMMAAHRLMTR